MDALLHLAAMADPDGLLTTAQIRRCGFDPNAVTGFIRNGSLRRLRRGWFVQRENWPADPSAQHRLHAIAVLREYEGRIAASHQSAAILHGLATYGCDLNTVTVIRTKGLGTKGLGTKGLGTNGLGTKGLGTKGLGTKGLGTKGLGTKGLGTKGFGTSTEPRRGGPAVIIRSRLSADLIGLVEGVPCCVPAVAGPQIAAANGVEAGVVTMDSALHQGLCTRADLDAAIAETAGRPGARSARRAAELADGRAESPGESRLRVILTGLGFAVESQVSITGRNGFTARVDLLLREHRVIVEFDGAVKYRTDPGNDGRRELAREKRREDVLRARGFEFVRIEWSDLDQPDLILHKINSAIRRSQARR